MNRIRFGIIGLGKIGGKLALQAVGKDLEVVGFDTAGVPEELRQAGVHPSRSMEEMSNQLAEPRKVFLYVPAGPTVEEVIENIRPHLHTGDIIIDGGNSYWGDSRRRQENLAEQQLHFIDLGTSGGIEGAEQGACFMAGGDPEAVKAIEPILQSLAVRGGYVHTGPPGTGHFVKLVHNGIEFGILQAIGEGMALLQQFPEELDILKILQCWQNGSVIRSWLIDLMARSYREHGGMQSIPDYVEDTGEVNWLVSDAMKMEVPIPVIAQSVMQLFSSREKNRHWARAVAMMRHEFGGHPFGMDDAIATERREGRVGASTR